MAIARDTYLARTTQPSSAASYTFAYTCTGSDRAVVLYIEHAAASISTATYAGVSMTRIHNASVAYGGVKMSSFILINPASGSNNFVVTPATNDQLVVMVESYTGVGTGGGTGGSDSSSTATWSSSSANQTVSTTTVANNSWITFFFRSDGGSFSAGTNVSIQDNVAGIALVGDTNAAITPAGSTNQTFTNGGGSNSGRVITVALAPYTAASVNSNFFALM